MKGGKIIILTTGQPSTNPRMLKEVDALIASGYQVKVFYSYWATWGYACDKAVLKNYDNVFTEVGGNPYTSKWKYNFSRLVHKASRIFCSIIPSFQKYSLARTTLALKRAAMGTYADLYIAHNLGALPAAAAAAKKWKVPLGFDAEDYHRGQVATDDRYYKITCSIEDTFTPRCTYITAASPLIGKAYKDLYPKAEITIINNVFQQRYLQPFRITEKEGLTLFWFSQTVGDNRGLEQVIEALNLVSGLDISIYLLGDCSDGYKHKLTNLAEKPSMINFLKPVNADDIFQIAAQFDVGLSTEVPHCINRDICLTNKLFSYLLAGNCIIASDTQAQKLFLSQYPGLGLLYKSNDPKDLADQFKKLYYNRTYLNECKQNALSIATLQLNWENESKTLLSVINSVLQFERAH